MAKANSSEPPASGQPPTGLSPPEAPVLELPLHLQRYQVVAVTPPMQGSFNRDPEAARVSKTGRTVLNTGASEWLAALAVARGLEPGKYGLVFASDPETREVAAFIVPPGTRGITPVRITEKGLVIYLHGVFKEYPQLRPSSTRWVVITRQEDAQVGPFLVIHLNLALTKGRSGHRRSAAPAPEQEQEPAQDAPRVLPLREIAAGGEGSTQP